VACLLAARVLDERLLLPSACSYLVWNVTHVVAEAAPIAKGAAAIHVVLA
jgi:hypothetical protein